ncbi:hypothetical protein [Arenimonas daejeonensis]|uniref:hypothetical protein n=1 Tax=Arenimonas daejeonensis TaxID=370777 RepID=UPI0011BEA5EB|nr:hypothetical protein [Arenimonas daejeonensis]
MRLISVALFLFHFLATASAEATDAVGYVYAKRAGSSELVYRLDGKSFNESELGPYFRENEDRWPKKAIELRLVFDGEVPLAWLHHARRTFIFLGFDEVRCFSGSISSARATEIQEIGQSIALPDDRW